MTTSPTTKGINIPPGMLWPLIGVLAGGGSVAAVGQVAPDSATEAQIDSLGKLHEQRMDTIERDIEELATDIDILDAKLDTIITAVQR